MGWGVLGGGGASMISLRPVCVVGAAARRRRALPSRVGKRRQRSAPGHFISLRFWRRRGHARAAQWRRGARWPLAWPRGGGSAPRRNHGRPSACRAMGPYGAARQRRSMRLRSGHPLNHTKGCSLLGFRTNLHGDCVGLICDPRSLAPLSRRRVVWPECTPILPPADLGCTRKQLQVCQAK